MSTIDIILIVVCAAAAIAGFAKGAVRQIGSAAGVVAAFVAARLFGAQVGYALHTPQPGESAFTPVMIEIMGCVIVFVIVWTVVFIIVRLVRGIISAVGLSPVDRLGGAAVMIIKWLIAISLILNVWYFFEPGSPLFKSSRLWGGTLLQRVMDLFPWLMGILNL